MSNKHTQEMFVFLSCEARQEMGLLIDLGFQLERLHFAHEGSTVLVQVVFETVH